MVDLHVTHYMEQVKEVSVGPWNVAEVNRLTGGNPKSQRYWLELYDPQKDAIPDPSDPERMSRFLARKYHDKRWVASNGTISDAAVAASGVLMGTVGAVVACCKGTYSAGRHVPGVNEASAQAVDTAVRTCA